MNSLSLFAVFFVLILGYSSGQPAFKPGEQNKIKKENDDSNPEKCSGCASDALNDPKTKELVEATLPEIDAMSTYSTKYKLTVYKATKQVVAGMKYVIKGWLILTDCPKDDDSTEIDQCHELKEPKKEKCEIIVWEQAWLKQEGRETKVTCESFSFTFKSEAS